MECTKPTIRYRANFTTTAKGIYTPDVTVELSGVDTDADFEATKSIIETQLTGLYETVCKVAEKEGHVRAIVEQK